MSARRLKEEQGKGRRSEERQASGWAPDDASSKDSLEAAAAQLQSWPCTPRISDATPGGSLSSASSLGLFRSLSAAPNGEPYTDATLVPESRNAMYLTRMPCSPLLPSNALLPQPGGSYDSSRKERCTDIRAERAPEYGRKAASCYTYLCEAPCHSNLQPLPTPHANQGKINQHSISDLANPHSL